jgi:hypothetical protein
LETPQLKKHPTLERAAIRCELTVVWSELDGLVNGPTAFVVRNKRTGIWRIVPRPAERNVERHPSHTAENALKAARGFRTSQGDRSAMAFTAEDVARAKDMVRSALNMFCPTVEA